ncbi:HindIII family type II restriction endonuclease [Escherichia coli]|uniref:HindIII family type II restriction endonuclease n=1 Tax=Escherichia coli TaxID=562 RepID=UPI00403C6051
MDLCNFKFITEDAIIRRRYWIDEIVKLSGHFVNDSSRVENEIIDEVKKSGSQALLDHLRLCTARHCCKVSDEAAFCLIQRPYISKTLLTRRISPRGSP